MNAFSDLAHPQSRVAVLTLLLALSSALACASGGCRRDDYRGVACRAAEARESLQFGMAREEALDLIGRDEVNSPWQNLLGLGPDTIRNPYDSETYTSPIGEDYEVVRFFVSADGNPDCPFIQGELSFQPLIFINEKLVGWTWQYLSEVLGRRITLKETRWEFGAFCDRQKREPPAADPLAAD
jgi:hypothetical protein